MYFCFADVDRKEAQRVSLHPCTTLHSLVYLSDTKVDPQGALAGRRPFSIDFCPNDGNLKKIFHV